MKWTEIGMSRDEVSRDEGMSRDEVGRDRDELRQGERR
jgi:hypothetical protein